MLNTPWGMLQDLTESLAKRARISKASAHRDFLGGIHEVDHVTLEKNMARGPVEEKNIIANISTGPERSLRR